MTTENTACESCRLVEYSQCKITPIPAKGLEVKVLGKRSRSRRSTCSICSFFYRHSPKYEANFTLQVRLFDGIESHSVLVPDHASNLLRKEKYMSVVRKDARLRYRTDMIGEIRAGGVVVFIADEEQESPITIVDPQPRYQDVREHIVRCSEEHAACQLLMEPLEKTFPFYLIDCEKFVVVRQSLHVRYIALSYVWGSPDADDDRRSKVGFQFEQAPLTVQDAVLLTRHLQERYLWVDRFCINQDNIAEKQTTLQNMHLIYERSLVTIVALYGSNHHSGLPGLSSVSRVPQHQQEIDKGRLVSSLPPISQLVAESTWNTRGWTYQEARLSRQCLFVTETQFYIVCRQSTWSESVPRGPESDGIASLLNSSRLDFELFASESSVPPGYYVDRLTYTQRQLTYSEDILDAFRGTVQRCGFHTLWGIPIRPVQSSVDCNAGFALGLLWMRRPSWQSSPVFAAKRGSGQRRNGFPTWSWSSLIADISQDNYGIQSIYGKYLNLQIMELPDNQARTKYHAKLDGNWNTLEETLRRSVSAVVPEHCGSLFVESDFITLKSKHRKACRWYLLDNKWRFFQPDIGGNQDDSEWPGQPVAQDVEVGEEALVLIQWSDGAKGAKTRLLLMVLDWIDDKHARRKGLLTQYRDEFDKRWTAEAPRTCKSFFLD